MTQAIAASADTLDLGKLAQSSQWRRLLHMPLSHGESDILSPDYFLSPLGRANAEAELRATLEAYQQPWPDNPNLHPRCRFPARYQWLARHIALPDYQRIEPRCTRLNQWSRLDQIRSVSLLLVSGYFGNPASTFGHALLRFNASPYEGSAGLLDTSLNFGAVVPEGEGMLPYVFKGLTGGYRAGFADKDYYAYDLVYGHNEFRDMWEYELVLPAEQQDRLVLHAWELMGREFTYYFLTRNCALRLAELLEVATDSEISPEPDGWYVPVELFIDLQRHEQASAAGMVRNVRYLPSNEKVLNAQFSVLSSEAKTTVRKILAQPEPEAGLEDIPPDSAEQILDVLTAYYSYRTAAAGGVLDAAVRVAKDRVLLKRLQLPPRTSLPAMPPPRSSPADASPPMQLGLAVQTRHRDPATTVIRWSPFAYDHIGFNGIEPDEMVLLDTAIKIGGKQRAAISAVDVFRVRKTVLDRDVLTDTSPWSWRVALGYRDRDTAFAGNGAWQLRGGAGLSWRMWRNSYAYALTEASVSSGRAPIALHPALGIVIQDPRFKLGLEAGRRVGSDTETSHAEWAVRFSRRISRDWEVRFELEKHVHESALLSVLFHH
ncbi:DUF4105 domain-containing protein [Chitinimonas sp. BJYL2]|uniref:Lnb N-terminal periplasmic domain-containing protein n=1 Tax=Chitinimonas sp. BJYL2 TaxID=2976696 RepID=UPI0022B525DB|nr:DUF4105 domain-containing protein [Chitinimonas sp. BJYL2]